MQRTLLFLSGWMLVFLVLGGGVYLWMGAGLANLAFFDGKSDEPYVVFEFMRAEPAEQAQTTYESPLRELLQLEEAQIYPSYTLTHVSRGTVGDEWTRLATYGMSQASNTVEVMTSTQYQDLQDAAEEIELFKLGVHGQLPAETPGRSMVLILAQLRESSNLDPLTGLLALSSDAQLLLDTAPDNLDSDREWDRLLALDFPDQDTAVNWLNDRDVALETEILNSKVKHLAIMLYAKS